jgi:hypothetical protein
LPPFLHMMMSSLTQNAGILGRDASFLDRSAFILDNGFHHE